MGEDISAEPVRIDVSDVVGEAAMLAGARFVAPGGPSGADALLFVCLPGGTYSHRYFDLVVDGHPGYSFARDLAARGHTVVAFDQLGTGDSGRPACEVGMDLQGAAAARAVQELAVAQPGAPIVGVGHSMGGYVAMFQQAEFRSYDALAILGTTNLPVAILELPPDLVAAAAEGADARQKLVRSLLDSFPEPFLEHQRGPLLTSFHLEDVPRPVLDADLEMTDTVVPRLAAAQATVPGITRDAAAMIDVPVFLAYGDVDVSPSPHEEPATYPSSRDVTLFLLESSAHCHNMATTRKRLWDRLVAWAEVVAGSRQDAGPIGVAGDRQ